PLCVVDLDGAPHHRARQGQGQRQAVPVPEPPGQGRRRGDGRPRGRCDAEAGGGRRRGAGVCAPPVPAAVDVYPRVPRGQLQHVLDGLSARAGDQAAADRGAVAVPARVPRAGVQILPAPRAHQEV
ncbi:hypothetical protein IWQ56_006978, partial [Coemansia nantahalensis]